MPTINQLIRKPRKVKKNTKNTSLSGCPQKKGVCTKVYVTSPVKPNSANRAIANVRLSNGQERSVYIPGETHSLQEHSVVLVSGGGAQDVSGNALSCIRGVHDLQGVSNRKQARSRYGVKQNKS